MLGVVGLPGFDQGRVETVADDPPIGAGVQIAGCVSRGETRAVREKDRDSLSVERRDILRGIGQDRNRGPHRHNSKLRTEKGVAHHGACDVERIDARHSGYQRPELQRDIETF